MVRTCMAVLRVQMMVFPKVVSSSLSGSETVNCSPHGLVSFGKQWVDQWDDNCGSGWSGLTSASTSAMEHDVREEPMMSMKSTRALMATQQ